MLADAVRHHLRQIRLVIQAGPLVEQDVRLAGVYLGHFHVPVRALEAVRPPVGRVALPNLAFIHGTHRPSQIVAVHGGERRRPLPSLRVVRVGAARAEFPGRVLPPAERRATRAFGGGFGDGRVGRVEVGEHLAAGAVVVAVPVAVGVARVRHVVAAVQQARVALEGKDTS